jgi:peptidoglycan/xylan/chitin deacetylase (PgdA/CDA1 family)
MINTKRAVSQTISEIYSLARIFRPSVSGHRILTYHTVGGLAYEDALGLHHISVENFSRQMSLLKKHSVVSLMRNNLNASSETEVSITFDDGYLDNLTVAAPILQAMGYPFTVFVTTDFIKNRVKGFLDPGTLKELAGFDGVTIGAHGVRHCHLTQMSHAEAKSELENSKKYLEDLLGLPVTAVAYPYGDINKPIRDLVKSVGYESGVTCRFDINKSDTDRLMLNRSVILSIDSLRVFEQKISGAWDWYKYRTMNR